MEDLSSADGGDCLGEEKPTMSRIVSCVMVLAVVVTASGCNCFGSSCRRPSFMEFRSPGCGGWCETAPACGPECMPAC